ncbi:MAG: helicase-related protein [Candidatus Pacearchaeota archaeon]
MLDTYKKFLVNITPREYQIKIAQECINKNCLVILPTGVGKTLIALILTIDRLMKFPSEKVLFLAPTRPLSEQHLKYFKSHLTELFAQMEVFTGKISAEKRVKLWQKADIIFSTPQCIANDLKNNLYTLENVSLLIEDEAHRCIKNYAYTFVAKQYSIQAKNKRILGLTASPGTDKKVIKTICENLLIESVEIRTRESEDVKKYLQRINFNHVSVELTNELVNVRSNLNELFTKKVEELKKRNLLFGPPTKLNLLETQRRIMRSLATGNRNFNLMAGASVCAQALKLQHAIELLETQTLFSLENYLSSLIKQANESKNKAVKKVVSNEKFLSAYYNVQKMISNNIEHPKIESLKGIIENKYKLNDKLKAIVFSQYRDSVIKICKELNTLTGIKAKVFVGQAKKTSLKSNSGLSQKEQQQIIEDFSNGIFNILCATSIGEEGLDIPEVNLVIFYEPVPSAIRKIQRAGRTARLIPGEIIFLITKGTRDEAYYWAARSKEKKMNYALEEIQRDLKEKNNKPKENTQKEEKDKNMEKQRRISDFLNN